MGFSAAKEEEVVEKWHGDCGDGEDGGVSESLLHCEESRLELLVVAFELLDFIDEVSSGFFEVDGMGFDKMGKVVDVREHCSAVGCGIIDAFLEIAKDGRVLSIHIFEVTFEKRLVDLQIGDLLCECLEYAFYGV